MTKYCKIPVVVDAWQVWLHGPNASKYFHEMPQWLEDAYGDDIVNNVGPDVKSSKVQIKTLEGVMTADDGDWIIQGVKGELYPCKPDIFALTYRVAPDPVPGINNPGHVA